MSEYRDKLFSPAKLNGLELRNRVIRSACYEGMCSEGYPSERLIDLHRELAKGGVGMTTMAYCAVEPDGRMRETMMYMHEGIRPQIRRGASRHARRHGQPREAR
jgi:2,4-dienoyl-CoA reductase-like NADH-dependent reductase (Old Yellow Enzyme family)